MRDADAGEYQHGAGHLQQAQRLAKQGPGEERSGNWLQQQSHREKVAGRCAMA
jgi:hypothetical protein